MSIDLGIQRATDALVGGHNIRSVVYTSICVLPPVSKPPMARGGSSAALICTGAKFDNFFGRRLRFNETGRLTSSNWRAVRMPAASETRLVKYGHQALQ